MKRHYVLMLLLASTACWAQTDSLDNQFSMSLNFQAHGEACGGGLPRNDDKTMPLQDRSSFLYGRTRVIADYQRPGLQAHAVVQNSAVWGMKGNQSLALYEGWAKLTARCGLFAQLGRVVLSYDDERIIGANDFATAALSHDVLRLGYEGHGHKAHVVLAYNQNGDNVYDGTYYVDGAQYYKTMQTAWYHYDVPKVPLGASLLFMNIGQQAGEPDNDYNKPKTVYQQMWGGYFNLHPKHLTLEGSYYRQGGKMVNQQMQYGSIRAWMASAKATVELKSSRIEELKTPSKPPRGEDSYGFTVGYDYLSGDDYVPVAYGGSFWMVRHSVERGFSPLYGSRTKFYGIMDYFYASAYINDFTPGLQNTSLGAYYKHGDRWACAATYHYLATATKLEGLDRTLGHSVELEARYRFTNDISLTAGYTQMMGTETMSRLKQGTSSRQARWGWISLVISPTLFTTKW